MQGKRQESAAAASGMSERSARRWKDGPLPSETKKPRTWHTRVDPFAGDWERVLVPLLERDDKRELEARTLLAELQDRFPGKYADGSLRTLQRRMRDWRAVHGPAREVMFAQEHVAGREGAFDFTNANELEVTINGEALEHLLFEFVLSFSGWTYTELAYSETFEAMSSGLQGAVWELGGVPAVWRSDNLSAATHEIRLTGGRRLTRRYADLLAHYRASSTRIEPGESHQNGVAEQKHGRTKSLLSQHLTIRGSRDFRSVEDYAAFLQGVMSRSNRGREVKLALEREQLVALPPTKLPTYTTYHPHVRQGSTVQVSKRTYSVPSRLIGHDVEVRQHATVVEVYYAGKLIETMPRIRGGKRVQVDYRHVIWSLVRKPGAFARYRYREELFPSLVFRRAYDSLRQRRQERADIEYLRILHLAATTLECRVAAVLETLLSAGEAFDFVRVRDLAAPRESVVPVLDIGEPDLAIYDRMLGGVA